MKSTSTITAHTHTCCWLSLLLHPTVWITQKMEGFIENRSTYEKVSLKRRSWDYDCIRGPIWVIQGCLYRWLIFESLWLRVKDMRQTQFNSIDIICYFLQLNVFKPSRNFQVQCKESSISTASAGGFYFISFCSILVHVMWIFKVA